jgi:hypothetical protein
MRGAIPPSLHTYSLRGAQLIAPRNNFTILLYPLFSHSGLFLRNFPNKITYAFLISLMRVTCPTHLTRLYLIILIIFDECYVFLVP